MHWTLFLFAFLALLAGHLLRAGGRGRFGTNALAFALCFVAMVAGIRLMATTADLTRPTEYDRFVAHAVEKVTGQPDRPILAFVGASFSRNALDTERLETRLREAGQDVQVVNLSLEGASLQERASHLEQFITLSGRVPEHVFLGVAHEFDVSPTYVFRTSKFSDRAIEQFTLDAAAWSGVGLMAGTCEGLVDCVKNWGFLGLHTGLNALNVGLIHSGEPLREIEAKPSYDPQDMPRETYEPPADQSEQLRSAGTSPLDQAPQWALSFREQQINDLTARGVETIGFYLPPVIDADLRAYTAHLCETELSRFPCIAPTDPALLELLQGDIWFDAKHLLAPGAAHYTDWLADELLAREVLQ